MKYRKLGQTDLNLSAITFGAWAAGGWMWGGNESNDAIKAIEAAFDEGVNAIDTAPIYGQGFSEEVVGEAVMGLPRDQVYLLTKFGMRWDLAKGDFAMKSKNNFGKDIDIYKYAGAESVVKECEDSLRRLRTDYIDLYQIHWPDSTTPIEETFKAVDKLIKDGKVRYAGVCNYSVSQMAEAEKYVRLASNQVPFSMLRREIEKETVPYCLENEKGILAYSPMDRGLLTGKMKPGQEFNEGDHRKNLWQFKDENIKRTNDFLQKIKPLADEKGLTLGQLVLLWTIEQPGITIALAGARNAEQAVQNARAMRASLSTEEVEKITGELETLQLVR
ncbi:aldo/keto reductase [Flavobacterium sp. MAH-1]|uniref:Aldo/keto reductase n=1 Tax=Flavobacterium agri TaxID=2743471 RepID=A0A7Y9C5J1_9FLAO|nr:aldo/keto reductase [Flavobacterium agri]NUY79398.1 aldo/keto reductase [Flavobacterium agri]NYA69423.1 aldo/keto reductase [Flavobacterium agri]